MASQLLDLAKLITDAASAIDRRFREEGLVLPSLYSIDEETPAQYSLLREQKVAEATALAVAAAGQLIATIRLPEHSVTDISQKFFISAAMGTASAFHMPEIIREAGGKGCSVEEIACNTKLEPQICARILRALSTHHIFQEVAPDKFAHNRISKLIDTGKSSSLLFKRPEEKYNDEAQGVAALMEIHTDESFKATAYLNEALKLSIKKKKRHTPLSVAFDTDLDLFSWYELPDNAIRRQRFSGAMRNTMKNAGTDAVFEGLDWKQFAPNSKVVDVGARVGHISLELLKKHPHLHIVVQDRPSGMQEAQEYWQTHHPEAFNNGSVTFEGNDFFLGQPVRDADVFLVRYILHDWLDKDSREILRRLRESAQTNTKLLVIDTLAPYARQSKPHGAHFERDAGCNGVKDRTERKAPYPLLENYGLAGNFTHLLDIQMMTILDGQERTENHMAELLASAGWQVEDVLAPSQSTLVKAIVARPVLRN